MFSSSNNYQLDDAAKKKLKIATFVQYLAVFVGLGSILIKKHNIGLLIAIGLIGLNISLFARAMAIERVSKYPKINFTFILFVHRVVGIIFILAAVTSLREYM